MNKEQIVLTNEEHNEILILFNKSDTVNKNYLKLDKTVTNSDRNTLDQYYKIKDSNSAIVIKIGLDSKKIEHLSIDHNYTSLKTLRKKFNL